MKTGSVVSVAAGQYAHLGDQVVLCDMDGVIADFDHGLYHHMLKAHPDNLLPPVAQRAAWSLESEVDADTADRIRMVMEGQELFLNLHEIPGAIRALNEMHHSGLSVYLCTAPIIPGQHCASEKFQWVQSHLGLDWASRMIITKDKTLVRGSILIDDNPHITGHMTPTWEHVVYGQDRQWHQGLSQPRLKSWEQWSDVLIPILEKCTAST